MIDISSLQSHVVAKGKDAKILFFLPNLSVGGAERHTVDLCLRLRALGYRCDILVYGRVRSPAMIEQIGENEAIFLDLKGMSEVSGWLKIWKALHRLKPDIIVAVNQTPLIVSVIERLLLATSSKIVCIFHTTEMQRYEQYQGRFFRYAARLTDLLVYVGANQQKVWQARGVSARKVQLIRNGIDLSLFKPEDQTRSATRQAIGLGESDFVLGIVAAFRIEKNHVDLVAAAAEARKLGVDVKVLFVGVGETKAHIEELSQQLGIRDSMYFVGEQNDVKPYISASDCGVLCSTSETFPLSAIEFLAMGRPMISADVGGASEIVKQDVNGVLYPPGDVAAFAQAIIRLADPAFRATVTDAAAGSVSHFSSENMIASYAEAFEALVQ